MLIDSNTILLDSVEVTSSAVTGDAVGLTSLYKPGRAEPVVLACKVVEEDFAGGTSLTFSLTESESEEGEYTDVAGSELTVELDDLVIGKGFIRFLPRGVEKPWIKMTVTPSGTFTAGKIFAAIVREDELPYEEGMYIDKGEVVG